MTTEQRIDKAERRVDELSHENERLKAEIRVKDCEIDLLRQRLAKKIEWETAKPVAPTADVPENQKQRSTTAVNPKVLPKEYQSKYPKDFDVAAARAAIVRDAVIKRKLTKPFFM